MTEKQCGKCSRVLPVSQFGSRSRGSVKLQSYCRYCLAEANRATRAKKRDYHRAYSQLRYARLKGTIDSDDVASLKYVGRNGRRSVWKKPDGSHVVIRKGRLYSATEEDVSR